MKNVTLRLITLLAVLSISVLQVVAQPATSDVNKNHDPMVMVPGYVPPQGDQAMSTIVTIGDFDNFKLGADFAETSITNNPRNPLQYYAVWNTTGTAGGSGYYTNNGFDWTAGNPAWTGMAGDVVVTYDSTGKLAYQNMYGSISGVKVAMSANNGQTWGSPVIAIAGADKNWMAADQTAGPYSNYLYGTMTASSGGNFARSTDQGVSWTNMTNLSTQNLPGMSVCVGPEGSIQGGAVYVVTNSGSSFASTYTFYKSTNGGQAFTQKSVQQFSNTVGTQVGGRNAVQNMRTRPYPNMACDNSFGPHRGRLYLVYASNNPSGNGNKPDIYCRYSDDGAVTWSSPAIANDDPNSQNNNQWMPAIWCEKTNGRLYLSWMDTRDTPTGDSAMIYATYTNDGVTFAANQRISNQKMKINCNTCGGGGTPMYEGDYNGVASNPLGAMLAWTDFREATFGSYVAYFPDFGMRIEPSTANVDPVATFNFMVPSIKLYSDTVFVSASMSGTPGLFNITFPSGNKLSSYPGQIPIQVTANGTPPVGAYIMTITAQGSNGTPVHKRTVTVNYATPSTYTVATTSVPSNGGTTSGGGSFSSGTQVTVTATANSTWSFSAWYESGVQVSSSASYVFTLMGNRNLEAHFYQASQNFAITVSASPVAGGSVSGGGSFSGGTTATVTATANTGYTFINWTENGNIVSTSPSYAFTVAADRSLVANFSIQQFSVVTSSNPANAGTTTGGGLLAYGTQATVVATPYDGYAFVNWTENGTPVSTSASYSFTVSASRNLVANFNLLSFSITTSSNPVAGGTTAGGGTYSYGNLASVSANAASGYNFVNWTESGVVVSTSSPYSFIVNAAHNLVANFEIIQIYTITTAANPANAGTTSGGGSFSSGTQATVQASANPGFVFVNWTDNGNVVSTSPSYSFNVTGNLLLTANFEIQTFTISTAAYPGNGGSTSGDGVYTTGTPVTVVASANSGFAFTDWKENSITVSTDSSYSFTASGNRYLIADFRQVTSIVASVNPTQAGHATGSGIYTSGQPVTVEAVANAGWAFLYWTESGNVVSNAASYTFTAAANRVLQAQMLSTVGTGDLSSSGIKIYPNPAKDVLYVEIDATAADAIQLVNTLGKVIYERNIPVSEHNLTVDLKGFVPGIYSVRLLKQENKVANYKLVIQK